MKKALICFLCLVGAGLFSQGIPFGQEFQVNTNKASTGYNLAGFLHSKPTIATLTGGSFIVCWPNWDQQGGRASCIYGQLFDESGIKIGEEFHVSTYTWHSQRNPSVAALSGGGFIACWDSYQQDDIWSQGVFSQLFNASGIKKSEEFQVNTYIQDIQMLPCVATLSDGSFVVCWESQTQDGSGFGIYGQLYNAFGIKKGGEFLINSYTNESQENPTVTALFGGGFVVCWDSWVAGAGRNIYGQLYDATGLKNGSEFQINLSSYPSFRPHVASLSIGGFIVCWVSAFQDGSVEGVYGQLYDVSGVKKGGEFQVNTYTISNQENPTIVALKGGGFIVCWQSLGQVEPYYYDVFGQLYDASGIKKGKEFQINTYTKYNQLLPAITAFSGKGFVVCWESYMQDGSGYDVYAKRFPENPIVHELIPFNILEPFNDSSIKSDNPTLIWRQPSDQIVCYPWELHYKFFVDVNPNFTSPQIIEQDQDTTVTLQNLTPGTTYFWKVLAKNIAGDSLWSSNTNAFFVRQDATTAIEKEKTALPDQFVLHQNYPNPFNPETTIRFDLPESGFVVISVYDVNGKLVCVLLSELRSAGSYSVKWGGKDLAGNAVPSGIYVCRMEARSADGHRFTQCVKMGLVR